MAGDLPQLGEQGLPAFIVIVDDQRRSDRFELIVQRQGRVAAGGAHQDQIRHLGGHRFRAWFADVQPRQLAGFGDLAPLAQKALTIGDAVVRRGGAAGDHRGVNRQQRAGEGHAGGDNAQRLAWQGVCPVAVGDLARPVRRLG